MRADCRYFGFKRGRARVERVGSRVVAIVEVLAVLFVTLGAVWAASMSPLGHWQRDHLGRPFFSLVIMAVGPLLFLAAARRPLTSYGIWLGDARYQLDIAWRCALPYAVVQLATFPLTVGTGPWHALARALLAAAMLGVFALVTRRHPTAVGPGLLVGALLLFSAAPPAAWSASHAFGTFVFYSFFLAPGEEILFRAYVQSRLNRPFGRPFTLFGVRFGWGLVIGAGVFGVFQCLNLPSLVRWEVNPRPWLGISMFFWGLAFGWLREKTGSVVAPIIAHGVPLGIAWAILGR